MQNLEYCHDEEGAFFRKRTQGNKVIYQSVPVDLVKDYIANKDPTLFYILVRTQKVRLPNGSLSCRYAPLPLILDKPKHELPHYMRDQYDLAWSLLI